MAGPVPLRRGGNVSASAEGAAPVTPSDSADLAVSPARALYIGGAGSVSVDTPNGDEAVVFAGLPAGFILPVYVTRVRSTGTSATMLVALY